MDINLVPEMIGLATALPSVALGMSWPELLAGSCVLLGLGIIAREELALAKEP